MNSNLLVQWNHVIMDEFRSKGLQPWEIPPRNMVCGWRGIGASFCSSVFVDTRPLRCVQRCHKEWWVESCNFVSSWLLWFYSKFLDAACIGCDWVSISVEPTNRTKPHISILLPRQHPITPTGLEGKNPLARRHPKTPVRTRPSTGASFVFPLHLHSTSNRWLSSPRTSPKHMQLQTKEFQKKSPGKSEVSVNHLIPNIQTTQSQLPAVNDGHCKAKMQGWLGEKPTNLWQGHTKPSCFLGDQKNLFVSGKCLKGTIYTQP